MTKDKPTILVVDDDKNTRDGLERALRRRYDVVLAEHGERALAILAAQHVDIILSDVRMPGMDGLTLLQRALAHRPNVICILLTAYGNVEVAVEAMKPVTADGAYVYAFGSHRCSGKSASFSVIPTVRNVKATAIVRVPCPSAKTRCIARS